VCTVGIYNNVHRFKKHGEYNILYENRSKGRNCKAYRKVAQTAKWREINISIISWRSVFVMEETGVSGEIYWSITSHWQTLLHNVASSIPRHERGSNSITTLVVIDTDCIGSCKSIGTWKCALYIQVNIVWVTHFWYWNSSITYCIHCR
jgi:hypothetical protein